MKIYVFKKLIFFIIIGCFCIGTGIPHDINKITENKTIANTALDCKSHCHSTPNCKLFNWNGNSRAYSLRSDLPKGTHSFNDVPAGIVGAKDCNNFKIIWPEIFLPEAGTPATTTNYHNYYTAEIPTSTTTTTTTTTRTSPTTRTTTTTRKTTTTDTTTSTDTTTTTDTTDTTTTTATSTTSQIATATTTTDMATQKATYTMTSNRYLNIHWT
jgi:hypothetical protein